MRFFKKSNTDPLTTINTETEEESNNKLSRITSYLNNTYLTRIEAKAQGVIDSTQNYQIGLLMFATGLIFMFASFLFLPLIVLSPYKFCALNAFGTLTLFASLVFIRGNGVIANLFGREKLFYTLLFFFSLAAEFYFSVISSSYLWVLVALGLNLASIAYLLLSLLPGGAGFFNGTIGYGFRLIKMLGGRLFGQGDNLLPI